MSSIHDEPLRELEPPNLLTPMDTPEPPVDPARREGSEPERSPERIEESEPGRIPQRMEESEPERIPQRVEERMNLAPRPKPPAAPIVPRTRGRRVVWAAMTVAGAMACFAAGAAMPVLTRHFTATAPRAADAKDARRSEPAAEPKNAAEPKKQETSPQPSAGSNVPAAAGPSTNQENTGNATTRSAAVPCDRQTWPNYGQDCLKRPEAEATAPAVRTVMPDRNPDGTPRAPQPAAASPPAAQPAASAQAAPAAPQNAAQPAQQSPAPAATQNAAAGAAAAPPKEIVRTPEESQPQRRAETRSWERHRRHSRRSESRQAYRPGDADREAAREDRARGRAERRTTADSDAQAQDEPAQTDRRDTRETRRSGNRRYRDNEGPRSEQVGESTTSRSRGDEDGPIGRPAPRDQGFFLFRPFEKEW